MLACVNEAFKLLTFASQSLNTYLMYMGQEGVYTTTYDNERNPSCVVCSEECETRPLGIARSMLLKDFLDMLCTDARFQLKKPSIIGEENNIVYMRGPLEKTLHANLEKCMEELVRDEEVLSVTDPTLMNIALSIQIKFE